MSTLPSTFHLSITGLRVKPGLLNQARFAWHAVRSFNQARRAPGILHVATKRINGVEYTVTAWRDRESMLAYVRSGAHMKAMQVFHLIAEGATLGLVTDRIPGWNEAHAMWEEQGSPVGTGRSRLHNT
ncbi:MAG: hypothetical protein JNL43_14545 [Flavobacteriales bacterium]|nr:hypothetical protein [Flavobacteriales bacterium]